MADTPEDTEVVIFSVTSYKKDPDPLTQELIGIFEEEDVPFDEDVAREDEAWQRQEFIDCFELKAPNDNSPPALWTPPPLNFGPDFRKYLCRIHLAAAIADDLMGGDGDWVPAENKHHNDNNKPLTLLL